MTIDLTDEQLTALKRAALSGDYHLLLGAGASRDSVNQRHESLPDSSQLAESIAVEFDVPNEPGDLLWRVYARAIEEAGADGVYNWLRDRFWGVSSPEWMNTFARTSWTTVWTLNLDDTFEQAYAQVRGDGSRRLITVNWDDDFRQSSDLRVVHLHGCVDQTSPRQLIFSLSEYQGAAIGKAAWPLNFRDQYGVAPFVIIGARLRDEPDIEAVVANRKPAHSAPSFYVAPNISDAVARDLRRWNLIPVSMTGESFAHEWQSLAGIDPSATPAKPAEIAFRVGRQFRELRTDRTERLPDGHNFIGGDEPLWADIQLNYPAELEWIQQAKQDVASLETSRAAASVVVYVGGRLVGRTTGLLSVGHELRARSYRTYEFVADERPDIDALLGFAAEAGSIALLFDSVADIADDINRLVGSARASGLKIVIVAVDQIGRSASILSRIEDAYLVHRRIGSIGDKLTAIDARRLVDKLKDLGRLGTLEEKRDRARLAHFRGSGLFDSMAQVENAPAFGRRVGGLVNLVADLPSVQAAFIGALASRFDRRLYVVDAARMLVMDSDRLVQHIRDDAQLGAILTTDGRTVRTRHRWMALRPCIEKMGEQAALDWISEAIQRIASRLGRATQRERNATALLVGELMRYSNLVDIFPSGDLTSWYESMAPTFGSWSARYWEQRAILSRHVGVERPEAFAQAESYALRAVSIVRDAYSLTTLATVLMNKAAFVPPEEASTYYDRAFQAYEDASNDEPSNIVTWFAYLRATLNLLSMEADGSFRFDGDLRERISEDWLRVAASISTLASASDSTKRDLLRLRDQHKAIRTGT